MKMAVYSCFAGEENLFEHYAKKYGICLVRTAEHLSAANCELAQGCSCVSVSHAAQVTAPLLAALARQGVRYVSTRSIGLDHIDLQAARQIGIGVGNISYSPNSVADYTLMLMLMAIRQAKPLIQHCAAQNYLLPALVGREMPELTVGVVGTGFIGSAVVARLQGFGCRILAYDLKQSEEVKRAARYVEWSEMLQQCDLITLHMPATQDTYHMVDRQAFALMKAGAVLVNTGRGSLVDTSALIDALASGKLGGAALDVLENEMGSFYEDRQNQPLINRDLVLLNSLPNVIITPHTAFYTERAVRDMVSNSIENCIQFEKSS